jgi:fibro-slime domain-containing protein
MNRVFSLLTLSVLASALQAQITDPIAGSEQLTLLPPVATGSEGEIHYTVDFKSRTGRTYVLEETNELSLTKWRRFPVLLFGNEIPVSPPTESPSGTPPEPPRPLVFTNSYDSGQEIFAPIAPVFWPPAMDSAEPRQFFRLRYADGLLDPLWGDYDRDGVCNNDEVTQRQTDPFAYPDEDLTDSDLNGQPDGLPDAWERFRLGTLDHSATDTNAAHQTYAALYALDRRDSDTVPDNPPDGLPDDWELFRFGNLNQTGTSANLALFRKDRVKLTSHRFGAQVFKYDSNRSNNAFSNELVTTSTVYLLGSSGGSMIVTYSSTDFTDISAILVWPSNRLYGEQEDPTDLATHYAEYTSSLVGSVRHYAFDAEPDTGAYVARDLLRTLDGRPLERFLNQEGAPRLRTAPLAITSLPLTHVGPKAFPIILRDFPYYSPVFPEFGNFKYSGLAESTDRILKPNGNTVPQLVDNQLDGASLVGLPRLAPAYYTKYPGDTGNRFAEWFTHPDAFGFNILPELNGGLVFNEEALPHKNDAGFYNAESTNSHAFTIELHLRVDNLSSESGLSVNSDDDLWIFINGQLVHDGGGRHTSDGYDTWISLSPFLETSNGSCLVDVFYAERQTSGALFKITPNNATLHPIYSYQVVAEVDLPTTLSYSLIQSPTGMTIDARTGRILWDYANPIYNVSEDNYDVTVSVSDSRGYTAIQSFTISLDL